MEEAARGIASDHVPNAVVEERSNYADADVNAQRVSALTCIAAAVDPESTDAVDGSGDRRRRLPGGAFAD